MPSVTKPKPLARVYCCCGWIISQPAVYWSRYGWVKIECVGCNKSTGYKSSLDVADIAWQRIANI